MNIQKNITSYNKKTTDGRTIEGIVIHAVGAVSSAKNNAIYYASKYLGSSAHYFCDSNEIWQSVDDKDIAWHCGTAGYYTQKHPSLRNANTIGIEMCQDTASTVSAGTIANTAVLVQYLMKKYNISSDKVVRHWDIVNKKCPSMYIDDAKWKELKTILTGESRKVTLQDAQNALKAALGIIPGGGTLKDAQETLKAALGITSTSKTATSQNQTKTQFNQNIKDLQWALNADGITDSSGNSLTEDGIWGKKTASAVSKVLLSAKTIHRYIHVTAWVQCRVGASVDGLFGSNTQSKVMDFQEANNLTIDGIVGKKTMLTLVRMYVANASY